MLLERDELSCLEGAARVDSIRYEVSKRGSRLAYRSWHQVLRIPNRSNVQSINFPYQDYEGIHGAPYQNTGLPLLSPQLRTSQIQLLT